MAAEYVHRAIEPIIRRAAREFPAVVLIGPRQSGKTTLLKRLYPRRRCLSLETPDVRETALSDPRGFVERYPPPVFFDEVQRAPDILPYIKERIDSQRDRPGQYLLSGSQNLLLMEQVTETLAGRAAILKLLPLSLRELVGEPKAKLPWEIKRLSRDREGFAHAELWTRLLRGGYPEIALSPGRSNALWHSSYIQTYLERDVRALRQVGDLSQFQSFLRALAARSAQLVVLSDIARDLGVAVNTIRAWVSVLEATFQIVVLRPWFANIGKRLVKTPKIYFTDPGTLCYLVGLRDPEHAANGPMAGQIFETAVMAELFRTYACRGDETAIHFWRTSAGREVDFLVAAPSGIVPIEVKLSATPRVSMATNIRLLREDLGAAVRPGYVIHPGTVHLPLGPHAQALPFSAL